MIAASGLQISYWAVAAASFVPFAILALRLIFGVRLSDGPADAVMIAAAAVVGVSLAVFWPLVLVYLLVRPWYSALAQGSHVRRAAERTDLFIDKLLGETETETETETEETQE